MTKLILSLTIVLLLSSCSWNEYFVISNSSQVETNVTYKLMEPSNGFPIFSQQPRLYKLNSSNEIDWGTEKKPIDLDTSIVGLKIKIPSAHALVLGELSNDNYTSYNQTFINDRFFNLVELNVSTEKFNVNIVPSNFDKNFKKENGVIQMEIK